MKSCSDETLFRWNPVLMKHFLNEILFRLNPVLLKSCFVKILFWWNPVFDYTLFWLNPVLMKSYFVKTLFWLNPIPGCHAPIDCVIRLSLRPFTARFSKWHKINYKKNCSQQSNCVWGEGMWFTVKKALKYLFSCIVIF